MRIIRGVKQGRTKMSKHSVSRVHEIVADFIRADEDDDRPVMEQLFNLTASDLVDVVVEMAQAMEAEERTGQ